MVDDCPVMIQQRQGYVLLTTLRKNKQDIFTCSQVSNKDGDKIKWLVVH